MRILALCGIAAPVLRLGLIVVLGALHPGYSQTRDFISELGAPDSPYAAVMNVAGIGLVGLLLVLFSLGLYRAAPRGALASAGAALLALSGLAFMAVGLLPCDRPGCAVESPSTVMRAHVVAGLSGMAAQSLAALAFGLRVLTGTGRRWYAVASLAGGAVALGAFGVLAFSGLRVACPGLVQKTLQASADVWVFLSAVHVLRDRNTVRP